MESIFNNPDNKMSTKSMQWKTIGDKIEGTYIGKRIVPVRDEKTGNMVDKTIYELKTILNEYYIVWDKPGIKAQMELYEVKLGQIIGFEYVGDKPNSRRGYSPTKTIVLWADPKMINEEWLKGHQEEMTNETTPEEEAPKEEAPLDKLTGDANAFFPDEPVSSEEIYKIARTKFPGVVDADIPATVMARTSIAYVEENFPRIIEALKQL